MKKYNVLVTGTSSYGVGEGLIKVINQSNYRENIKLIGASNSNLTACKTQLDNYYILPNAIDMSYLVALQNVLDKEKIDILIPGSEAEMEILAQNKHLFKNVDIWVNDYNIIELFNDKKKAYDFFSKNNFDTPELYENNFNTQFNYPFILKPIKGKSSENIHIARNYEQLQAVKGIYEAYNVQYLIQRYIENKEEYTVSLINLSETTPEVFILKRILCKGATQYASYENNEQIKEIAFRIHEIIKDEIILNIQIIRENDCYYIIEINPRFSGSAPMRALLGFNEFDLIFSKKYLDKDLRCKIKENSYVLRGYKEFIYDI